LVDVSEFVGEFKELQLGNVGSWCRASLVLVKNMYWSLTKAK